jgi:hypothetical protein
MAASRRGASLFWIGETMNHAGSIQQVVLVPSTVAGAAAPWRKKSDFALDMPLRALHNGELKVHINHAPHHVLGCILSQPEVNLIAVLDWIVQGEQKAPAHDHLYGRKGGDGNLPIVNEDAECASLYNFAHIFCQAIFSKAKRHVLDLLSAWSSFHTASISQGGI